MADKINLELLGVSKKPVKTGDVFVIKPKGHGYVFGVVASSETKQDGISKNLVHLQIFDKESKVEDDIPDFTKLKLLVPPIATNKLGWTKGYFKTVGHTDVRQLDSVRHAAFWDYDGTVYDDQNNPIKPYSVEYTGEYGVHGYPFVDSCVSFALKIPLAVEPKMKDWSPLWYEKELKKKYRL